MASKNDSEGDLERNPLWKLHRRRMLEVDSALGDWRFDDLREEARDTVLNAIERKESPGSEPPVENPAVSHREGKLRELSERREAGEISPYDFDLNFIFRLNEIGEPLTRKDLAHETGNQAVVLSRDTMDALGCLDFIHVSGERKPVKPESLSPDDVRILYPEDLGDEEGKPYVRVIE